MLTYNGVHVNSKNLSHNELNEICAIPPIAKTTDYTIYSNNETMIISFNQDCQ